MPTVLIWKPVDGHPYGHAALQTDKYHISMWPLKDGRVRYSDVWIIGRLVNLWPFRPYKDENFRFLEVLITGHLHFHEQLDWVKGGSPENLIGPISRHEIVNVTNKAINREYEKFLRYNEINPEEVTLEAANRKQQFEDCYKKLPRTRYSLVGDVIVDKRIKKPYSHLLFFIKRCLTPGWGNIDICRQCIGKVTANQLTYVTCPFYHKAQSCVSMCFNLIEMADRRRLVCLVEARNNTKKTIWSRFWQIVFLGGGGICLEITVPNFEKHVVQKYWKEGSGQRVHYDSNDFQKRTRFLRMSENIFKKVLMVGPTISFMAWLHNSLNYSLLDLFGLTGFIHFLHFVLLFLVQMKLFPHVRIPKPIAFVTGVPFSISLLHYYFSFTFINFCFFFLVVISKFILHFLQELRMSEASITGRLHFHEQLDCISEGSRENPVKPTVQHEIANVTNEAINSVYEKLFPSVRLPKLVAFVTGIIVLLLLVFFSYLTNIDAFHLE